MGYENEDDFIVGLRNHFAIFGWAAKFYLKFLIVLTKKPLTIKELSLFSIIFFYFRFGYHDNNENFINLFIMPYSKCLPSFKTLVAQITKIAHVIIYFIFFQIGCFLH